MRVFLLCLFLCALVNVQEASKIENIVATYFETLEYKTFSEKWNKFRRATENAIERILTETYSYEGMNVYARKIKDPYNLTEGVLVSDNIVHVLFKDLYLTQLPRLTNPEVSFALASNVLRVEAKVDRMFIQAGYQLFRNISDVLYGPEKFDSMKTSPFNLQHVKSAGEVTIVAEDCKMTGSVIATLNDKSVNLGQDSIKLVNCLFSVEISTPGLGSPPVIAPYFSKEHGKQLEMLLGKPICNELLPKLQGAVFTYVNTSSMFGDFLPTIRRKQRELFTYSSAFMNRVVRNVNQKTLDNNGGIGKWKDINVQWSDKNPNGELTDYKLFLKNVTVNGLDSAYSAQNGGPYKVPETRISETIRFSELQVHGFLQFGINDEPKSNNVFYCEIGDVTTALSVAIDALQRSNQRRTKSLHQIETFGWRYIEIHAPNYPLITPHSLLSGVILNELPRMVIEHLSQLLREAFEFAGQKVPGEQLDNSENRDGDIGEGSGAPDGNNNEHNVPSEEGDVAENEPPENGSDDGVLLANQLKGNQPKQNEPMFEGVKQGGHMFAGIKQEPMFEGIKQNEPMFERIKQNEPMFEGVNQDEMKFDGIKQDAFEEKKKDESVSEKSEQNYPLSNKKKQEEPETKMDQPMFKKIQPEKPMFQENIFGEPMFGEPVKKDGGSTDQAGGSESAAKRSRKGRSNISKGVSFKLLNSVYETYEQKTGDIDSILYCPENDGHLNQIEYRLFTRDNIDQYILLNESAVPVDPNKRVDLSKDLLNVVTHGWLSSTDEPSVASIKDAYLRTRRLNVIAVDWRTLANTTCYLRAVLRVKRVADSVSRFLEAVKERYGVSGRSMHLIGHSLGAHVVGIAASKTSFRILRVTGLDPAGPIFEFPSIFPPNERIDSSCADFVDIFHTSGGLLGFREPIGHIDFYPNGGILMQPDCISSPEPASCSHRKAYEYYVDTIYNKTIYPAYRCEAWSEFIIQPFGNCDKYYSVMGDGVRLHPKFKGKYYSFTTK